MSGAYGPRTVLVVSGAYGPRTVLVVSGAYGPRTVLVVTGASAPVRPPDRLMPRPAAVTLVADRNQSVRPPDLPLPGRRPPHQKRERESFGRLLLSAVVAALLVKTFLLQAFYIPSESMLPTLAIGDRVLVEKVSYRFSPPERGDVVVFRNPDAQPRGLLEGALRSVVEGFGLGATGADVDLVKRIVGLGGETVEARAGVVYIDGVALDEAYNLPDTRDVPPATVPEGEYWVLGDNRGNSRDSRLGLGTIEREALVGRAFAVVWPSGRLDATLSASYPGLTVSGPP